MHASGVSATRAFRWSFYVAMAAAMAATVFLGFAPTYYLKTWSGAPPLALHVHAHGLVFTSWIAILIAQTTLVANGRVDLHRRLGMVGAGVAVAMLVVGLTTAIAAARRGFAPPGAPPALSFLAIPFFDMIAFAVLAGAGLALRGRPETHKRLMLLATVAVIDAAVARFPLPVFSIPPVFFATADLFILAGMLRDRLVEGRIHVAYLWGGLCIVAFQVLRLAILDTQTWLGFAVWLTSH